MNGTICYHYVGGMLPYGAKLKSKDYSDPLWAFGESFAEARKNLLEDLLPSSSEIHIPPDEEIEF